MTSGVKVELELSPEGATQKPFAAISINHLRIKEAGKQAAYTVAAPTGEYKDNLQLNIKEHFEFPGIIIAQNLLPKVDLVVKANLDLSNEGSANTTQLRAYLSTTGITKTDNPDNSNPFQPVHHYTYSEQDPKYAFDLSYAQGRLSLVIDKDSAIVPGYLNIYGLLASPLGKMIEGILQSADPAQATAFADRYWKEDGSWNDNFKALVVDNVSVSDILSLIKPAATTSEEPAPTEPEQPTTTVNYLAAITKIFGMINAGSDKLTISTKGLLSTICDLATAFGTPLTPTSAIEAIDAFIGDSDFSILQMAFGLEGSAGNNFVQKLKWLLDRDANFTNDPYTEEEDLLNWDFYFTEKGLNWDLSWYGAKGEPDETTSENKTVGIIYNSEISFDTTTSIAKFDLTEYEAAKKAYDEGYATPKAELDAAKAETKTATEAYNTAKAAYEATTQYKAYETALEEYANDYEAALVQYKAAKAIYPSIDISLAGMLGKVCWFGETDKTPSEFAAQQSSTPMYAWITAGAQQSGAEWDALKTSLDTLMRNIPVRVTDSTKQNNLGTMFDKNYEAHKADSNWTYDGELFNAYVAFFKALSNVIEKEEAAQATTQYTAMTTAEETMNSKQKTEADKQAAYDALANPYFAYFYWDLKA